MPKSFLDAAEAAMASCQERGLALHAVTATIPTARADAAHCDALSEGGVSLGPLHGVPYVVKDIIDVAGVPTKAGSVIRANAGPATSDATVVARLRAAGAVAVAKAQTVEFAFGGWGTNKSQGTPINPWKPATPHTPGGSSSGTGVLVGAGIVPAGFGTDTGGSVRIPASFCGCVGHKSSIGLVSRSGVVALSDTFDTVGPLTDTVRRAAEMLAAMQGEDRTDPSTVGISRGDPLDGLDRGISGLRIAVLTDEMLDQTQPDVLAQFHKACDLLREAGATLSPFTLPHTLLDYQSRATTIIAADAYGFHAEMVDDPASPINATTRIRVQMANAYSARDLVLANRQRAVDIADFLATLDRFDALVLPTSPSTAIPTASVDEDDYRVSLHTRFGNYLSLCGLSVPTGLTEAGLPVGLQIVARHLDDPLALRIGQAFETVRGAFPAAPLS